MVQSPRLPEPIVEISRLAEHVQLAAVIALEKAQKEIDVYRKQLAEGSNKINPANADDLAQIIAAGQSALRANQAGHLGFDWVGLSPNALSNGKRILGHHARFG
jgi:hypothetical protein